jgi:hypothetical protein
MKLVNHSFRYRGKQHNIDIGQATTLEEAIRCLSPRELLEVVNERLVRDAERAAVGRKKRVKKISLDLNDPRVASLLPYLTASGLLRDPSEAPAQAPNLTGSLEKSGLHPSTESAEECTPEAAQVYPRLSSVQEPQSDPQYSTQDPESLDEQAPESYNANSSEESSETPALAL